MSKRTLALIGILSAYSAATTAQASAFSFTNTLPQQNDVRLSLGMGWLEGSTGEYVYKTDGSKLSQLDWQIKPTPIAKIGLSWEMNRYMTFGLDGWTTLSPQESQMDDYDWMRNGDARWSHHSTHPGTTLRYANALDASLTAWVLRGSAYRVGIMMGYQTSNYAWSAYGGQYRYDDGKVAGNFPDNTKVVSLRQRYDVPYIGASAYYRRGDFELNATAKYSDAATGQSDDTHFLRGLYFQDQVDNARFYAVSLKMAHYLTPNTKMFAEVGVNYFEEAKGRSVVTSTQTQKRSQTGPESVGMSHQDYNVTLGMQYTF